MRRPFSTTLFESRWIQAANSVPVEQQKVMIVLHGMSDSLHSFKDIDLELDLPFMNYLVLNAPDKFEDGFSWYRLEPYHARGARRSRELLSKLVKALKADGWRARDIFFLGHSQGALMACDCLLNSDEAFGGVVGVSGYMWFFKGWQKRANSEAVQKTPWLMTYGTRDKVIPPDEIREDLRILWKAGVPVSARAFQKGHDFEFKNEVPFIREWLQFVAEAPSKRRRVQAAPVQLPEALPLVISPRRSGRRILPFT